MSTTGGDLAVLCQILKNQNEVISTQKSIEFGQPDDLCSSLFPTDSVYIDLAMPNIPILGTPLLPTKRPRVQSTSRQYLQPKSFNKLNRPNQNSQKLSEYLKKICEFSDTEDEEKELEEKLIKKIQKSETQGSPNTFIGVRRSQITNTKKYRIDSNRLPKLCSSFESFRPEQLLSFLARVQPSSSIRPVPSSSKKITASKELPRNPIKLLKSKVTNKNIEGLIIKKAWNYLIKKDIPKGYKGMVKVRSDLHNNTKKFSQACSKEILKKANKLQREAKESIVRAKRLQREMVSFWRRKERETADMRRKREKEENEARKKREEEEESLKQRKRLEYIMRQSDIYSHFMAQKLGLAPAHSNVSSIGVDEENAKESVRKMIKEHREHLEKFGNTETNNEDLKDIGLTGLDRVDDTKIFSRIENVPPNFLGNLKDYQMKGLRWLDNLYDQGINGILADEMGLGKTIQTIALLTHLCYNKGIWGPFLVICPSSTLHNWESEVKKFCPSLIVLPYWGGIKERKSLRRYMHNKKLGCEDSMFHICITSYQLVLTDEKVFQKVMWKYMILDEAHAIKNTGTQRWNILLNFNARNKLLLTGTPIQNSMAELWALLHFIMPKLFDSHEHFQEWFSKDIEAHSTDAGTINHHQLQKLHAILKPFMLRRIKKDVESEIGKKTEIEYFCELTHRQKVLYDRIKRKLNIGELFSMTDSKAKVENLMNLMMQFRKVCNHPDLFERRPQHTPVMLKDLELLHSSLKQGFNQLIEIRTSSKNPISITIPRIVYKLFTRTSKAYSIYDQSYFWLFRMVGFSYNEGLKMIYGCSLATALIVLHFAQQQKRLQGYKKMPLLYSYSTRGLRIFYNYSKDLQIFTPAAIATPIEIYCSSMHFVQNFQGSKNSPVLKKILLGNLFKPSYFFEAQGHSYNIGSPKGFSMPVYCNVDLPGVDKLLLDSAKLKILDKLLKKLHQNEHRVLIFCQMTKMLDILEDFLYSFNYEFLRMDGSTNISDRRDLIDKFQNNPEIFIFILSTRAGGLGVNLTAADTVIFYDIDWNPTMDAQATDRVHRIGQSKPVTVYRLITQATVEERILKRAKQKQTVQSTVYAGGAFKADIFRPSEVMELIFDDKEFENVSQTKKFIGGAKRNKKKKEKEVESFNISEFVEKEIS
jgi:chromatin-remodeling ATPase INO80